MKHIQGLVNTDIKEYGADWGVCVHNYVKTFHDHNYTNEITKKYYDKLK